MLWGSWRALVVWAAPSAAESAADAGVPPRARPAAQQGARVIVEQGATGARLSDAEGPGSGHVERGSAACRRSARACKTCALGAPRARTAGARRNASVV